MKRMARTLNIYKRSKRNPDTPHDPLHPNIYALHGKKAGFETDIKEVWFVGAHCGTVLPICRQIRRGPVVDDGSRKFN
jgi:hypothetical protein